MIDHTFTSFGYEFSVKLVVKAVNDGDNGFDYYAFEGCKVVLLVRMVCYFEAEGL